MNMTHVGAAAQPQVDAAKQGDRPHKNVYYRPAVDIVEGPDELTLIAEMPGLTREQIDINFERGNLQIYGRVPERQPKGCQFHRHEYGIGDYYRAFQVSEHVDSERISAEFALGVLTLHLPKSSAAKSRKIAVQAK
jgi:HSP20 family molecular chaperone IbpA